MRQARADVPRWKRTKARPASSAPALTARQRRKLVDDVVRELGKAGTAPKPSPAPARLLAPGTFQRPVRKYRHQLAPVWWLSGTAGAACTAHWLHAGGYGVIAGLCEAGVIAIVGLGRKGTSRALTLGLAGVTAAWGTVLSAEGWTAPWPPLLLTAWAALMWPWAKHYRWRAEDIPEPVKPGKSYSQLWAESLGARGPLDGSHLISPEQLPAGGVRYVLNLKPGEHDTSVVFGQTKRIASLFRRSVTEVYPERFPDNREHQVMLTILPPATIPPVRLWDGERIDPETGLAEIGDYPDGTATRFRFWQPMNGCPQSAVLGTTGAGKSGLFDQLLSLAVTSPVPIVPFVLDPQQGQSLPDWSDRVIYAKGPAECFRYLLAFEAGMTARSEHLARTPWRDADGYEHPGFGFYDPHLSGLPIMLLIFDEAHLVIGERGFGEMAKGVTANLAKLNRKAGGHMILAAHSALLSELGDATMRAMLLGGNGVGLRLQEGYSAGHLGLEADPRLLPKVFADGSPTAGIGYVNGPDGRPDTWMRLRKVRNPRKAAMENDPAEMDPVFRAAWGASLASTAPSAKGTRPVSPLSPVPAWDDGPAEPGRGCADAILAVLTAETERAEIMTLAGQLVTAPAPEGWGRAANFSPRTYVNALASLSEDGRIRRTKHGRYAPARGTLTPVGPAESWRVS